MRISGGEFRGRALKTAVGPGLRPAMAKARLALFSMLGARGLSFPGARVLDLFAGTGSLGIEAISRGASLAVFVEQYPPALRAIRENLKMLGLGPGRATVAARDVAAFLRGYGGEPFDLVFIDPPYGQGLLLPALTLALDRGLVVPDGLICAEVESGFNPATLQPLGRLDLLADRLYGQTRMLICRHETERTPSIPEPSTP